MLLKIEKRSEYSKAMVYLTPLIALALTVLTSILLFELLGVNPIEALYQFFVAPLDTEYEFSELFVKATPLMLCAIGLSVGFRANVWNIGAEGQLTMGAIVGSSLFIYFPDTDSIFMLPAMIILGAIGGAAWGAIPAFLKTRFNANEILTSLMLVYVAILVLSVLVHGPWRDPAGFNFPESQTFSESADMPILISGTRMHFGTLLALLAVFGAWIMMARTLVGFQVKVIGEAPRAGGYAGFSQKKIIWFSLLFGGALAGVAGLSEVSGPIDQVLPSISPGYGFTAIIVAFLGRLHPVGIFFASLLMALTYLGGETAQINLGLPVAVTGVFQGMVLFFLLACDVLVHYRFRLNIVRKATS
ncbi:ABC transporter permease [uncultured Sneathiella sp.]|jgi:simple sugar transport system permease protein|uniref:ABC transporter permease n=1 Tax=uncultured Sneathiella sp. TaxID=879315 RepID=UPI0030DC54DF|tara:strand:+ start:49094 stop:50170 length:1077 start_codon:yes stop_codon:yes gene_type:complete